MHRFQGNESFRNICKIKPNIRIGITCTIQAGCRLTNANSAKWLGLSATLRKTKYEKTVPTAIVHCLPNANKKKADNEGTDLGQYPFNCPPPLYIHVTCAIVCSRNSFTPHIPGAWVYKVSKYIPLITTDPNVIPTLSIHLPVLLMIIWRKIFNCY